MLYQYKVFHCPFCHNSFSSRDTGRYSNFPLLLHCGHPVCENCAKISANRHKKIVCQCQLTTELCDGDLSVASLLPDIYILGVLNASMKRSVPSLKLKMMPAGKSMDKVNRIIKKTNYIQAICDECINREAIWSCEKCEENFCNICFDHIHSKGIKTMQKHEKRPIDRLIYNSLIEKSCAEHSNRNLEFYCDEDSELACSHCCVTGKHKGHNVLTVNQKNLACQGELKAAYDNALKVKMIMSCSEKKLLSAIPEGKMDNTTQLTKICNHFRTLHAALQLREHELIQQIEEINNSQTTPLEKMRQQLVASQENLKDLITDAERTLKDPGVVINSPVLIQKLEESKSMLQHLVCTGSDDDNLDIDAHLDEVDVLPLLKTIGRITANTQEKYELKAPQDFPDGYIFAPIPVTSSVTTETESLRSEVFF